ncbi:MAG: LuxR C-terminal-related transcriptional regulator [Tannerella sp.]|jgi:DNA-binding CsgD family transcriptional regulator|nr:LuxR C-terminal-related transcriptional regulator [Tannerella sp.]
MLKPRRIAIILPDVLQSIGLRSLLIDYFSPVEIEAFHSFENISPTEKDLFDYYFALPEIIVLHADFFMLKRGKIIPVVFGNVTDETTSHNHLIINTTQEAIIEQLRKLLKKEPLSRHVTDSNNTLSTREIDVLQLIVRGSTNKDIADKLCISLNTVLTHRKNITSKLGIKTIPGLTFYAITNGIISGDEIEL